MRLTLILLLSLMALSVLGEQCLSESTGSVQPVTIFAAASMTNLFEELAAAYTKESGIPVRLNTAGSSNLARQIEAGTRPDVFCSANRHWADCLLKQGLVHKAKPYAGNRLVVIVPRATPEMEKPRQAFLAQPGRIAVGNTDHVPAGMYAREALLHLNWLQAVEKRLLPCSNVRAALRNVEQEETDWAIVYQTDAAASRSVRPVFTIDPGAHTPIRYMLCPCTARGRDFDRFARSALGLTILRRHGFTPPEVE